MYSLYLIVKSKATLRQGWGAVGEVKRVIKKLGDYSLIGVLNIGMNN